MTEEGVEEESISWDEEWTVLEDDGSTRRDRAPAVDDAEEALQISSPLESPLRATPTDARDQESDGVSVISESSEEEAAVAERIVPYRSVQRREDAGKEEVAPRFNILVVCCLLLTAIGVAQLGSRMYFETDRPRPGEACRVPRPTDNERLLEPTSREFCRVEQRSSAEEASSSVVEVDDRIVYPFVERDETKNERSGLSDRLQIFLRTVCLLLGDIRRVCDTRSLFTDLAKLRILLTDAIGQADESMKSENEKFLEKMEHRLASIDDAFVADLTRALDKSSSKNEKRLEKIRDKMKERLCLLRNTMERDSETGRRRRSPETDDAFLGYCGETRKILTVDKSETKEAPSVRAPDSDNSKRRGDDGYWPNVSEEHREASWRISKDRGEAAKYRRESSARKKSAGKSEPLPRSKSVKKKTVREREEGKKRKSSLLPGKTDGSLPAVTTSNSGDEYWYDSRRDPVGSRPRRNKSKRKNHETDESNASSDTSDEEQQDIAANGQWQFARCNIAEVGETVEKVDDERNEDATRPPFLYLAPESSFDIIEDVEMAVFLERVSSLFRKITKKLELAAALPLISKDPEISEIIGTARTRMVAATVAYSSDNDEKFVAKIGSEGNWSVSSSHDDDASRETMSSVESACSSTDQDASKSSAGLHDALRILNGYPVVRKKVEAAEDEITRQSKLFLRHIEYLIEHWISRIRSSPLQEKLHRDRYRNLWHENHRAQRDIDGTLYTSLKGSSQPLITALEQQRTSHGDLVNRIASRYEKDRDTVERLVRDGIERTRSIVDRSERRQITEHAYSETRQTDLHQYLVISNNRSEIIRETNQRLEEEIRSKRFKLSSRLTAQIAKFDTEMGERCRILEQLGEEFELGRARKERLEEETKCRSATRATILDEIERREAAVFREKLEAFARNRAAIKIQRWWRLVSARRKKLAARKKKRRRAARKQVA